MLCSRSPHCYTVRQTGFSSFIFSGLQPILWSRQNPPGYAYDTTICKSLQWWIMTVFPISFWLLCLFQLSHATYKVYCFVIDGAVMLLSCSAKKVTKECGIGEALRKCALPYVPHPPLRRPVFKNVPIFEHLQLKNLKVSSR